jgi:hypothetical protein
MKPATPLPFKLDHNGMIKSGNHAFTSLMWGDTEDDGHPRKSVEQNMAYLSHAANAYPRLIAVLRSVVSEEGWPKRDAAALLRELGETK